MRRYCSTCGYVTRHDSTAGDAAGVVAHCKRCGAVEYAERGRIGRAVYRLRERIRKIKLKERD